MPPPSSWPNSRLRNRVGGPLPVPRSADLQGHPPRRGTARGAAGRSAPRLPRLMADAVADHAERLGDSCRPTRATRCMRPASMPRSAVPGAPFLEIGSYCGKSAVYLGAGRATTQHGALRARSSSRFRGEPAGMGMARTRSDRFRRRGDGHDAADSGATVFDAGLEESVVALVGRSEMVAQYWSTPLALLFIDGGHGRRAGPPRLRTVDAGSSHPGAAGHPRRVRRPGRGRPTTLRDLRRALESGNFTGGDRRRIPTGSRATDNGRHRSRGSAFSDRRLVGRLFGLRPDVLRFDSNTTKTMMSIRPTTMSAITAY